VHSRTTVHIIGPLLQLVNLFHKIRTIYCDNEASFNFEAITSLLKNRVRIDFVNAAPLHSIVRRTSGTVPETLTEIEVS